MVEQGDIILVNFDPQLGHEQSGYRPALIISNKIFNEHARLYLACPISSTNNNFPLHIRLDNRTKTQGSILCEHIKSLDLHYRKHKVIEHIPDDILKEVIDIVYATMEILNDD